MVDGRCRCVCVCVCVIDMHISEFTYAINLKHWVGFSIRILCFRVCLWLRPRTAGVVGLRQSRCQARLRKTPAVKRAKILVRCHGVARATYVVLAICWRFRFFFFFHGFGSSGFEVSPFCVRCNTTTPPTTRPGWRSSGRTLSGTIAAVTDWR